jgi:hypothetical protein
MTEKAARLSTAVARRSVTDSSLRSPTAATAATSGGTDDPAFSAAAAACCSCCWSRRALPRCSGDVTASSTGSKRTATAAVAAGDGSGTFVSARLGVLWPLLLVLLLLVSTTGAGVSGDGGVGEGVGERELVAVASDLCEDGDRARPVARRSGSRAAAFAPPSSPCPFCAVGVGGLGGGRRRGAARRMGESCGLLGGPSLGKLASSRGDPSARDGGGVWYSSPGCDEGDGGGGVSRGGGGVGTGGGDLSGAGVRGVDGMVCVTGGGDLSDTGVRGVDGMVCVTSGGGGDLSGAGVRGVEAMVCVMDGPIPRAEEGRDRGGEELPCVIWPYGRLRVAFPVLCASFLSFRSVPFPRRTSLCGTSVPPVLLPLRRAEPSASTVAVTVFFFVIRGLNSFTNYSR